MRASVSVFYASLRLLSAGLLLTSSAAFAADPVVKIFGIGQGFLVPPQEPVRVQYQVIPELPGNHSFYLDGALLLVRDGSRISRTSSGAYAITYPGGIAQDRVVELRICVDAVPAAACDQVSIRAGQVLMPGQMVEVKPVGVAGHLPAQTAFDINYTVGLPSAADRLLYVDDVLRERRAVTRVRSGPEKFRYPGTLEVGEKRMVRICVDEESATCGFAEVTGGPAPHGVDLPEPFLVESLPEHFQVIAGCTPVCGYYSNVYYGDPAVSWVPDRGDGMPDGLRMDLYYSGADGRLNPDAVPRTLIIYAHSAGSSKESLLSTKRSLLNHFLRIANNGAGVAVASADFRHPTKQMNPDRTPVSVADLSYLVQFARQHAAELNINPDDIFIVGSSLGGGIGIHAATREIANPADPAPVRTQSSAVRGIFINDGQTSFAPHWFRNTYLEPAVWPRYQSDLLDDEERLLYGHAIAGVNSNAPLMELTFSTRYIDHKVSLWEFLTRTADPMHLPNYGLVMEAQYRLHGVGDRIRVRERYAGNFGQDAARFITQNRLGRD